MRFFRNITRRLRAFRRNEDGNATLEFVLLFPAYMWVFFSSVDAGLMMTRNAMLERGVDLVVREIRLNTAWQPDQDELKTLICDVGGLFGNCIDNLRVETYEIDPFNPVYPSVQPSCRDRRTGTVDAGQVLAQASANKLVMIRVCALVDPIVNNYRVARTFFQGSGDEAKVDMMGLGSIVPLVDGGGVALVVTSMYVKEPL